MAGSWGYMGSPLQKLRSWWSGQQDKAPEVLRTQIAELQQAYIEKERIDALEAKHRKMVAGLLAAIDLEPLFPERIFTLEDLIKGEPPSLLKRDKSRYHATGSWYEQPMWMYTDHSKTLRSQVNLFDAIQLTTVEDAHKFYIRQHREKVKQAENTVSMYESEVRVAKDDLKAAQDALTRVLSLGKSGALSLIPEEDSAGMLSEVEVWDDEA